MFVLILHLFFSSFLCSWLLHDPNMKIRSSYAPYLHAVDRFFTKLFEILTPLQVSKSIFVCIIIIETETIIKI